MLARLLTGSRGSGALATVAAVAILAACDIPTDTPSWDTTWIVPVEGDRVTIAQVLPDAVQVADGQFVVTVPAGGAGETLGALCGDCAALDGLTVPKPAFGGALEARVDLPAEVREVRLGHGGALAVTMDQDFGFDLIRPAGATAPGRLSLVVTSGAQVLGSLVIDGASQGLPSGVPLTRTIALAPGGVITGSLTVTLAIESPAGDPVELHADRGLRLTVPAAAITVAEAAVVVADREVHATSGTITAGDLDADLRDRADSAAVALTLTNPLTLGGTLSLSFEHAGAPLIPVKTVPLGQGTATVTLALSAAEVRALLGAPAIAVVLRGHVAGTGAGQTVRVTPADAVDVATQLTFLARLGA